MHPCAEVDISKWRVSWHLFSTVQSCKHRMLDDSSVQIDVLFCAGRFLRTYEISAQRWRTTGRYKVIVISYLSTTSIPTLFYDNIRARIKAIICLYYSWLGEVLFTAHTRMMHSGSIHHRHLFGSFWMPYLPRLDYQLPRCRKFILGRMDMGFYGHDSSNTKQSWFSKFFSLRSDLHVDTPTSSVTNYTGTCM